MVGERNDVGGYACFFTGLKGVDEGDFVGEGVEELVVGGEGDEDLVLAVKEVSIRIWDVGYNILEARLGQMYEHARGISCCRYLLSFCSFHYHGGCSGGRKALLLSGNEVFQCSPGLGSQFHIGWKATVFGIYSENELGGEGLQSAYGCKSVSDL